MWRALFIAIGIMLAIVGIECLLIDSATLSSKAERSAERAAFFQQNAAPAVSSGKTVSPPEYIPWSLMASGTIVILYAFTLPARLGKGG